MRKNKPRFRHERRNGLRTEEDHAQSHHAREVVYQEGSEAALQQGDRTQTCPLEAAAAPLCRNDRRGPGLAEEGHSPEEGNQRAADCRLRNSFREAQVGHHSVQGAELAEVVVAQEDHASSRHSTHEAEDRGRKEDSPGIREGKVGVVQGEEGTHILLRNEDP